MRQLAYNENTGVSTEGAGVAPDDPATTMLREQYRSLARLVPFLYICIVTTTFILCFAERHAAPVELTFMAPVPLLSIMLFRLRYWLKARRCLDQIDPHIMRRDILGTRLLAPSLTISFMMVAVIATLYDDFKTKILILVMVWISSVVCAFCLFALPEVAILMITAASVPVALVLFYQNTETMIMLALVMVIISGLFAYILRENFKNFAEIVASRSAMAEKHRQAELARDQATTMAFTDLLTGLSNRRHFEVILQQRSQTASSAFAPFAVGMLDLDGFKPINDVYGHAAGDSVLRQVALRLAFAMEGRGCLARMGGDEFAVIVENVGAAMEAIEQGRRLQACFDKPFQIGPRLVSLKATCGFCLMTNSHDDPARLVDRADMALYRLKGKERGGIAVFDANDESLALERARIEHALRLAVANDTIEVHFQPIIDLETGQIRGFESLARWTDAELGSVSPSVFIPIAEQVGLIEALTDLLLRKAARIAAKWPDPISLSFNISPDQLSKTDAGPAILAVLRECGLSPARFEAEITETALMKDLVNARTNINYFRAAGIRVSLDDFGTGYSSLSQIRALPLDKIKIDKSFVDDICNDPRIATLVRSVIEMCRGLGLACVAEGIEDQDQLNSLRLSGCDRGQGYLISRPVPAEEANRLAGGGAKQAA